MTNKLPQGALSYCAAQVERFDHERFLCTLLAPAAIRESLFALYALNIELSRTREMVREPLMGQIRLQWWREGIAELYQGNVRQHEVLQALATILPGIIDEEDIQAMIDARELDLSADLPTSEELLAYARGIGGRLMQVAARLAGTKDKSLIAVAGMLGTGAALAGIIRSIPYHAAQEKCYLPADLLEQMETDPYTLYRCFREIEASPRTIGAVEQWLPIHTVNLPLERSKINAVTMVLATEAKRLLEAGTGRQPMGLLAVFMLARLAKGFLRRFRKRSFDIFHVDLAARPLSVPMAILIGRIIRRI